MIAHFARRISGGVFTFAACSFIFYSLLVWPSLPKYLSSGHYVSLARIEMRLVGFLTQYRPDRDWPQCYLAWLYDPDPIMAVSDPTLAVPNPTILLMERYEEVQQRFATHGVLSGDLGRSIMIDFGTPALDLYGINLVPLLSISLSTLFLLMALATVQRIGHRPFDPLSHARSSEPLWVRVSFPHRHSY